MATSPVAVTGIEVRKIPCQKGFFDLDSFQDVKLKKFFDFVPVATVAEAAARLGNDAARLVEILNEGLIGEQRLKEYASPNGWHLLSEDGKMSDGEFTGTPADSKIVNQFV